MSHRCFFLFALLGACGGDPNQRDGGTSSGDGSTSVGSMCSFLPSAPAISIAASEPLRTLTTIETRTQNIVELITQDALPSNALSNALQTSCRPVGTLLRVTNATGRRELQYLDSASAAPELVEATNPSRDAALFYDASCAPIVVQSGGTGGPLSQYNRSANTWSRSSIGTELSALLGTPSPSVRLIASAATSNTLHLLATTGSPIRYVHGTRANTANAAWTFRVLPSFRDNDGPLAFTADNAGTLHVVYRSTATPCDPCDMNLYYAQLRSGTATWSNETIHRGVWGMPGDEFNDSPSIAIAPNGTPIIATHFQRRVATGSFSSTELRVYARNTNGNEFCHDVVARETDQYAGSDGVSFTGASPFLAIDSQGRIHVVFLDLSVWHDSDGLSNHTEGNLRHALFAGNRWQLRTLFSQPGQRSMPMPLHGINPPQLHLSSDGNELIVFATEFTWQTNSIYNRDQVPTTLRTIALRSTFTTP